MYPRAHDSKKIRITEIAQSVDMDFNNIIGVIGGD